MKDFTNGILVLFYSFLLLATLFGNARVGFINVGHDTPWNTSKIIVVLFCVLVISSSIYGTFFK